MNKDLVRIIIDWLAGIGAMIVTKWFTDKRADELVEAIPDKDSTAKTYLKAAGIGAIQGAIICMTELATITIVDKLIRKIQNK